MIVLHAVLSEESENIGVPFWFVFFNSETPPEFDQTK